MRKVSPFTLLLVFLLALCCVALWRTAKERDAQVRLYEQKWMAQKTLLESCSPNVFLVGSANPLDAVSYLKHSNEAEGRACVFLNDGTYGRLHWMVIYTGMDGRNWQGHLKHEWQPIGKYKP